MHMRSVLLRGAALLAIALAAGVARGVEVKLRVTQPDGEKAVRSPAAVTSGVPFARGAARDVARLSVKVGEKHVPAQFAKTVGWDDGSIRWALMDVQVDLAKAGGKADLVVCDDGGNTPPASPVTVDKSGNEVKLATAGMELVISKSKFNLIGSLKVDGQERITSAGRGLVLCTSQGDQVVAGPPAEVKVEQAGPMRAVVCVRGKFPGVHKGLLGYTARFTAYAGQKLIKVHVWLENDGAAGYFTVKQNWTETVSPTAEWFAFKGMAVELGLGESAASAVCEGAEAAGKLKVMQVCRQGPGPKKDGSSSFYTLDDMAYTITSGEKELKKGGRTDGVVEIKGKAPLTAAIREFWQNYEKAIELDSGTLKLWLWPVGGQWPRPYPQIRVQLYDATLESMPRDGLYVLPGSVHKGHEFILDFTGRSADVSAAELGSPLFALASPEYYASTEAAPGLFGPPGATTGNRVCDIKLASWERMTRSAVDPAGEHSLQKAREVSAFAQIGGHPDPHSHYGWMDWGDVVETGVGPTGLHYDWIWIMMVNAMRTGDMNYMRLGSEMARHRMDIDQFWSDRDPPECRGLERGAGGVTSSSAPRGNFAAFHSGALWHPPGPSDNWLVGVAAYYMLTGDPQALECTLRNAQGLKASWDYFARNDRVFNPTRDMAANGWSIAAYCAAFDVTGEKSWLEEAGKLFRDNISPVWKKRGPFLHDPSRQWEGQDYIKDDIRYCYAVAALCELHRRTGDQELFKLLSEGCQNDWPENSCADAPMFLCDLYAYVGFKAGNAELLAKAAAAFGKGFPASKCPPVFLTNSSTWSRTSATTLRTSHLLQYVNWKLSADAASRPKEPR